MICCISAAASSAPSITDWITAVATAVVGLIGVIIAIWQWLASGFRPRYQAWIDSSHMGIWFNIRNSGRAPGIILTVHVAKPQARQRFTPIEDGIKYAGFHEEIFQGFILPGLTASRIIIEASQRVPDETVIRVRAGNRKLKTVELKDAPDQDIKFTGIRSLLPPGTIQDNDTHT
jgi:hypothetical protein